MGGESSKSDSNSSKSNSDSSSNSANNDGKLEEMVFQKENENKIINRVWIVKKSISLSDGHVDFVPFHLLSLSKIFNKDFYNVILFEPKQNVFKIKNLFNSNFKHWAIILELSNSSYVNIQFGRDGFSLKEFNKTEVKGESVFNSIIETWGEENDPYSFCYLGKTNYNYNDLKNILIERKDIETKKFKEEGKTYYNALHNNCQHFACDIEKILFNSIKVWHSFGYYLEDFFKKFFPNININKIKEINEKKIKEKNKELFKKNIDELKARYAILSGYEEAKKFGYGNMRHCLDESKINLEKLYSFKYEDFLD